MTTETTTTKKDARILANIEADKEIVKNLPNWSSPESILENGKRYLKATRERSTFCVIHQVSRSGMSRNLSFFQGGKGGVLNFDTLFAALRPAGVSRAKEGWRVGGCGMDMVFHTHYCLVNTLARLGFISAKQCRELEQMTPVTL